MQETFDPLICGAERYPQREDLTPGGPRVVGPALCHPYMLVIKHVHKINVMEDRYDAIVEYEGILLFQLKAVCFGAPLDCGVLHKSRRSMRVI